MNADRMDQETAERLLGGTVEPSAGPRPVVLLLTAARAAPRPAELAGEDVAVLAFRRERHGRLHAEHARHPGEGVAEAAPAVARRKRGLAGFGGRAAVVALALVASGGVALAAATGPAPRPPQPPTATTPAPADPPAVTAPVTGGQAVPGSPATSGSVPPASSVTAEMAGPCRAYQAVAGDDRAAALDNPAFSGLIAAAGDRQRVADYCTRVLAARPAPDGATDGRPETAPSRRPQPPSPPDNRPTAAGPDRTGPSDGRHSRRGGPPT